jgi:nucleotide-binding universal stress UspA family protein
MRRYRHILVGLALDATGETLTEGSLLACRHAALLARNLSAKVRLYHSTSSDEFFDLEGDSRVWALREGFPPKARATLEREEARLRDSGIDVELTVDEERAWLGICRTVMRDGVDLVIVGTRNRSDFDFGEARLGTVTVKLMRKCPCAVWAVKPGSNPEIGSVLAATDRSESVGGRVLEHAAYLAEQHNATLHVVHALRLGWAAELSDAAARRAKYESARSRAEQAIVATRILW